MRKKEPVTLRSFLAECRETGEDVDIYVDGIDAIAYCGTELTEEGERYFKDALDLRMDGRCVTGTDEDYDKLEEDETGNLQLAWTMLVSMAGYCSCEDYDTWFKD